MFDYERIKNLALECGFSEVGELDVSTMKLREDVREMCAANRCTRYNHNWCCPPGVGSLSECETRLRMYHRGIIVQTVGVLEDELDGETMMETEADQKQNLDRLRDRLLPEFPDLLCLGSGTCTRCKECTYPDAPCRFPKQTFASMEAFGLLVTEVCQDNDVPYYHGKLTITYTGCFLLE